MGVPKLSTHLRAVASTFRVNAPNDNANSAAEGVRLLVIDGPGFVYHVYHLCVCVRSDRGFDLRNQVPYYSEVVTAVVSLLDALQQVGLNIDSIFFDGYLPRNKTEVRLERLQQTYICLTKLIHSKHNFLSSTPSKSCMSGSQQEIVRDLMNTRLRNPPKIVPHQPFVVPCLIEALQNHPTYGKTVKVVPGEAEVFCKLRSDDLADGMIITNDSDLFLMMPTCLVGFLDTMYITGGRVPKLDILTYSATQIFERLGRRNLVKIGYQLSLNPRKSLEQCAALVENSSFSEHHPSYRKFRETYFPTSNTALERLPKESKLRIALELLDPRTSELVIDYLFPINSDSKATISLTAPIEDVSRASAWRVSSALRLIAYKTLSICQPDQKIEIIEIDRRGDRAVEQIIRFGSDFDLNQAFKSLSDAFSKLELPSFDSEDDPPSSTRWYWLALNQVLEVLEFESSRLPSQQDLERVLNNATSHKATWSAIHLQAQVEATLYSYRILKQIIEVYISVQASKDETGPFQPEQVVSSMPQVDSGLLAEVQSHLATLPPIAQLHERPGQGFNVGDRATTMISQLAEIYGFEQGHADEKGWRCINKRTSPSRWSETKVEKIKSGLTSNPYSLLEVIDNE